MTGTYFSRNATCSNAAADYEVYDVYILRVWLLGGMFVELFVFKSVVIIYGVYSCAALMV